MRGRGLARFQSLGEPLPETPLEVLGHHETQPIRTVPSVESSFSAQNHPASVRKLLVEKPSNPVICQPRASRDDDDGKAYQDGNSTTQCVSLQNQRYSEVSWLWPLYIPSPMMMKQREPKASNPLSFLRSTVGSMSGTC